MNLHRAANVADWQSITTSKRNGWQNLAQRTQGIVTPGNIISLMGLGLVATALWLIAAQSYWLGLVLLIVGRLADLFDGWAAAATGTKSPLGEKVDATFDKLGTFATLVLLAITGIMPWVFAVGVLAPQLIVAIISLAAYYNGRPMHPSRFGKVSMGLAWVCLPAFIAATAASGVSATVIQALSIGLAIISILIGLWAMVGYLREMRRNAK